MSKGMPIGLTFVEKVFGIILVILGTILAYYTYTNLATARTAASFSLAAGILLIILGLVLIIAKAE